MLGDGVEAEAGVEAEGGVELFDVDCQGFGGGGGFGLEGAEEGGAEAAVAVWGEEGDVHDADLGGAAVEVEAADRFVVEEDEVEDGAGVVRAVVGVLGGELLGEEGVDLGLGPVGEGDLFFAGAGVDAEEEVAIGGSGRAEGQVHRGRSSSSAKRACHWLAIWSQ